ncbi:PH domain-containing protein [Peribacillus sp. SCS-37]|uniref:PH domain-containing protein n=1 Tax=Paraperibacillus esterisolvens TaxID=3115296 RepID=UPI0039069604
MSKFERLHPAGILVSTLRTLKGMLLPFLLLIVSGRGEGAGYQLLFSILPVVISIAVGIFRWRSFSYGITDGELRIYQGVLLKKSRYIRLDKIQSLDITQGVIQRLFKVVSIKIETAGGTKGGEPEAVLEAITSRKAEVLGLIISGGRQAALPPPEGKPENRTYSPAHLDLWIFAATSGRVGVIFSGAAAVLLQFQEVIPYKRVLLGIEDYAASGSAAIALLLLAAFLLAYGAAIINILLKLANFSVERTSSDLIVSSGLIETRQVTIPFKKIQAILISENPFRQPLGYVSVSLYYAGGTKGRGNSKTILLPLIKKEKLEVIFGSLLPEYPLPGSLHGAADRSKFRFIGRPVLICLPAAAALSFLFPGWGYASFLLVAAAVLFGGICFRDAGWYMADKLLMLRNRGISRKTYLIYKGKIQSLQVSASPLQRAGGLLTITAVIISGTGAASGKVRDLEKKDAQSIMNWFTY